MSQVWKGRIIARAAKQPNQPALATARVFYDEHSSCDLTFPNRGEWELDDAVEVTISNKGRAHVSLVGEVSH